MLAAKNRYKQKVPKTNGKEGSRGSIKNEKTATTPKSNNDNSRKGSLSRIHPQSAATTSSPFSTTSTTSTTPSSSSATTATSTLSSSISAASLSSPSSSTSNTAATASTHSPSSSQSHPQPHSQSSPQSHTDSTLPSSQPVISGRSRSRSRSKAKRHSHDSSSDTEFESDDEGSDEGDAEGADGQHDGEEEGDDEEGDVKLQYPPEHHVTQSTSGTQMTQEIDSTEKPTNHALPSQETDSATNKPTSPASENPDAHQHSSIQDQSPLLSSSSSSSSLTTFDEESISPTSALLTSDQLHHQQIHSLQEVEAREAKAAAHSASASEPHSSQDSTHSSLSSPNPGDEFHGTVPETTKSAAEHPSHSSHVVMSVASKASPDGIRSASQPQTEKGGTNPKPKAPVHHASSAGSTSSSGTTHKDQTHLHTRSQSHSPHTKQHSAEANLGTQPRVNVSGISADSLACLEYLPLNSYLLPSSTTTATATAPTTSSVTTRAVPSSKPVGKPTKSAPGSPGVSSARTPALTIQTSDSSNGGSQLKAKVVQLPMVRPTLSPTEQTIALVRSNSSNTLMSSSQPQQLPTQSQSQSTGVVRVPARAATFVSKTVNAPALPDPLLSDGHSTLDKLAQVNDPLPSPGQGRVVQAKKGMQWWLS